MKKDSFKSYLKRNARSNLPISAVAGAAGLATHMLRKGKLKTLLIEAKYQYGTKLFKVYDISEAEEAQKLDRLILKEVSKYISQLKTKEKNEFPVRENVTTIEEEHFIHQERLIEEVLY